MSVRGYIAGDYWMVCDRCGFDYRRSQMRETWDRLWVCPKDYEIRQPQDFVRGRADKIRVPVSRSQPEDVFLETNDVTPDSL